MVSNWGPFQQHLVYMLTLLYVILQHHTILMPAPAKSTASIKLTSMAKGATAMELEALGHSVGGKSGCEL
jgi:hypothetical protein